MARGITVEIMGMNLVVSSDDGDEWARTLAAVVDEKIRSIRAGSQTVNSINLAILAALNLADELEHLRRDHQAMLERLERLNQRLSEAIGLD
jgi:cell division protein ZapA